MDCVWCMICWKIRSEFAKHDCSTARHFPVLKNSNEFQTELSRLLPFQALLGLTSDLGLACCLLLPAPT